MERHRPILLIITAVVLVNLKVCAQTWNIGYPDASKVTATLTDNALIIRGKGDMKSYPGNKTWHNKITSVRIENGVTNIGHDAFYDCHQLESITIAEGVKKIGEYAFKNCYNLKYVIIPNSVTIIERNSFDGCKSLKSIIIPNSVTQIGMYAFFECFNLDNLLLGNGLSQINDCAFRSCHSLSSISIPKNTTTIANSAFNYCENLLSIEVENGNVKYISIDGVLFNKKQDTLIAYPNGKKGKYVIPQGISVIGSNSFCGSKISSVSIPKTVKVIAGDAFRYCRHLKCVNVPNSVTVIDKLSFANCDSLVRIKLGRGITEVNQYILTQSEDLLDIKMDRGNERFRSNNGILFNKRRDTLIMYPKGRQGGFLIPKKVKCIRKGAFSECQGLTEITISKNVTSIEDGAFQYNRNLKRVTNRSMAPQSISEDAFWYVRLEKLILLVPQDVVDVYRKTEVWKNFGRIEAID